jgi:hypothetical protein
MPARYFSCGRASRASLWRALPFAAIQL